MKRPFTYNPPSFPYLHIIHADDDILVLDKPSGLLSVPGRAEDHKECLESRVQEFYPEARIIHRLDMATSGLIIMALNAPSHRNLGLQFERRHIGKSYIAKVWGNTDADHGNIDLPLICDWPNRPMQKVDHESGKPSQTSWKVLTREGRHSIVELIPKTGRTHQLRVHMLSLGHPILGDELYAHDEAFQASDRLLLHAHTLSIHHPSNGEKMSFTAPCPFYDVPHT